MTHPPEIFAVPIDRAVLLYAPLHGLAALMNRRAAGQLREALAAGGGGAATATDTFTPAAPVAATEVAALVAALRAAGDDPPQGRTGPLGQPYFLGLLPTRGCNMACRYCDFAAPKTTSPVMSPEVARVAIDGYLRILDAVGARAAEVQFFGGEPFHAPHVVHFAVTYARLAAGERGLPCRFEVTTNGLIGEAECRWIADNFDAVVLSLDGPPDIQDRHRPALGGRGTSAAVMRSAAILSEGSCELVLRACVSRDTAPRLPEIAQWFGTAFRPGTVCFEALQPTPLSDAAGLAPPDPYEFAAGFDAARRILAGLGIEAVLSTADTERRQVTFCPVGRDALIVSPEGDVDACYLLEESWRGAGLDMRLGRVDVARGALALDPAAVARVRGLNLANKPRCRDCFCRHHCAGGCHVNHGCDGAPGSYDDLCLLTRVASAARLLRELGQDDAADAWLADRAALERTAVQCDDRLLGGGGPA